MATSESPSDAPMTIDLERDPDEDISRSAGFFDMDGTLLRGQASIIMHDMMSEVGLVEMPDDVRLKIDGALMAYRTRRGRYRDYIRLVTEAYYYQDLWKGARVDELREVAQRVAQLMSQEMYEFTRELSDAAKATGRHRAIISGSPQEVVEELAREYGVGIFLGSRMERDGETYTGKVESHWVDRKDEAVRVLAKRYGFDLAQSFAIGDTLSDAGMFECVRYPVCFNPNTELLSLAKAREWPVVIETRGNLLLLRWVNGSICEPRIADILPSDLAAELVRRIPSLS